jgi:hypothetical protein
LTGFELWLKNGVSARKKTHSSAGLSVNAFLNHRHANACGCVELTSPLIIFALVLGASIAVRSMESSSLHGLTLDEPQVVSADHTLHPDVDDPVAMACRKKSRHPHLDNAGSHQAATDPSQCRPERNGK